jgi:hypothetical protein
VLGLGVAPKAIVGSTIFHDSDVYSCNKMMLHDVFISGARSALSIGVAPEAMIGCSEPIIGSMHEIFDFEF